MHLIYRPRQQLSGALVAAFLVSLGPGLNAQLPLTTLANNQTTDSAGNPMSFGYGTLAAETDGMRAYFYVGSNSGCATNAHIDSIPIEGGTATPLVSGPSGISICDQDYLSGSYLYFHVQPRGASTSDSGFFVVPAAGGAASDAIISGDPSPIGTVYGVESSGGDGLGNLWISLSNSPNSSFSFFGSVNPTGQLVQDSDIGATCDGVTITGNGMSATDATMYARILTGGSGNVSYNLITLANGAPSTDCQNVVFKMRSDGADVVPAGFPTPFQLHEIGVAHGMVYLGFVGGDLESPGARFGIFALQSGALTELADGTDTFATAGNYIAFSVANGTGFGQSLNGLYGADMNTGQLRFVTAATASNVINGPAQGSLSSDGHLVFVESYSTTTSPFFAGTLYSADIAGIASTVTLSAPQTAVPGQSVTLTASVTPSITGSANPTGTVTFYDGATVLGSASLGSNGTASMNATFSAGTHTLSAGYSGDGLYGSSTSTQTILTVTLPTTVTLTASPQSVPLGSSVTLSAAVAVTGQTTIPTGSAVFTCGGTPVTVSLNANGSVSTPCTPSSLGEITASVDFLGNATYSPSSATTTIFVTSNTTPQLLPNGYYTLTNGASSFVLDDPASSPLPGTAIYQYPADGGNNQLWLLSYNGQGFYTIQNKASQLFLTAISATPGTNLVQGAATNDDTQLWSLTQTATGIVITNKATGRVMDDAAGSLAAGPSIILWPQDGGINQSWTFGTPPQVYPDGSYNLRNLASSLVLDDPGSSSVPGTPLYQWYSDGGLNQVWNLKFNGFGFYTIANAASNLMLTGTGIGQSVVQATATNDDTQLWILTQGVTGVLLTNKATGLVLDEANSTTALGPYILMWPVDGGVNQTWTLDPAPQT